MISKTDCRITKEYNRTTVPNPDGLSKDSTIRISRFSTGQFLPPSTSDVPLALQILASIQAAIWVGDVKAAFTQGEKGQRLQKLYAYPPQDGFPGESGEVVVELLAEIMD